MSGIVFVFDRGSDNEEEETFAPNPDFGALLPPIGATVSLHKNPGQIGEDFVVSDVRVDLLAPPGVSVRQTTWVYLKPAAPTGSGT